MTQTFNTSNMNEQIEHEKKIRKHSKKHGKTAIFTRDNATMFLKQLELVDILYKITRSKGKTELFNDKALIDFKVHLKGAQRHLDDLRFGYWLCRQGNVEATDDALEYWLTIWLLIEELERTKPIIEKGTVMAWAGEIQNIPDGWALFAGPKLSQVDYPYIDFELLVPIQYIIKL